MTDGGHTWGLVLAAGQGSRLRRLTINSAGIVIPKQFCSLQGGPSLLQEALGRAAAVASPKRICTVVAEEHRRWWEAALARIPRDNVIVQPENRGTGNGILLPLLHIMRRDPDAQIVLLPSDHHVRDERTLERSLRHAVSQLVRRRSQVILLGIEPEETDPGLGYMVPVGTAEAGVRSVERFVEKPPADMARQLITEGALWNVFIVVARARALLDLFTRRYPEVVAAMRVAVARDAADPAEPLAIKALYRSLPEIDFSRHVAQGSESRLRVLTVPACGWTDLGTPARVARALERVPTRVRAGQELDLFPWRSQLNLATQHAQSSATRQLRLKTNMGGAAVQPR